MSLLGITVTPHPVDRALDSLAARPSTETALGEQKPLYRAWREATPSMQSIRREALKAEYDRLPEAKRQIDSFLRKRLHAQEKRGAAYDIAKIANRDGVSAAELKALSDLAKTYSTGNDVFVAKLSPEEAYALQEYMNAPQPIRDFLIEHGGGKVLGMDVAKQLANLAFADEANFAYLKNLRRMFGSQWTQEAEAFVAALGDVEMQSPGEYGFDTQVLRLLYGEYSMPKKNIQAAVMDAIRVTRAHRFGEESPAE